jgi:hypothetical protein
MNLGRLSPIQKLFIAIEVLAGLALLAALVVALVITQPENQPPAPTAVAAVTPGGPALTPLAPVSPTSTATRRPWTPTPRATNTRVLNREVTNRAAVEAIQNSASNTRGLRLLFELPLEYHSHGDFALQLPALSVRRLPEEEARWQAVTRVLGFGYQPRISGTITDQVRALAPDIGGYYDVTAGKLVVVTDREALSEDERINLAHTYTHALQDQAYNLSGLRGRALSLDQRLALEALIEGDATLTMGLFTTGNAREVDWQGYATRAHNFERLQLDAPSASTALGEIDGFRYQQGTAFALAVYQAGGFGRLNKLLQDPPASSEQVLHPAQLADAPAALYLTDLAPWLGGDWGLLAQETIGEFVLGLHLRETLAPGQAVNRDPVAEARAWEAVAGWDGDRLQIYADGSREAWLLISAWDSRGDAEQFFAAYQDLIRLELGEDAQQVVAEETRSWWQQGRRIAYVSRQDTQVLVVWSPDEETLNALLSRLSGF